jgi:transposase
MGKGIRFVGLDVHADSIAASIAEPDGEVRRLGMIPNTPTAVARLVKKLAPRPVRKLDRPRYAASRR